MSTEPRAVESLPPIIIVALVSQYDFFLSRLIRTLIEAKPDILNSSEKTLTLKKLQEFSDIEAAKEYILEKEIESVIRESHREHFSWLERKFSIKLRENLDILPDFIELVQRRNLFAHCNGVVSSQYIDVCTQENVQGINERSKGECLGVDEDYLKNAQNCLIELATKLAYTLSRKVINEQKDEADNMLNTVAYELIESGNFKLANKILNFAVDVVKRHGGKDITKGTLAINLAQSYKWQGLDAECHRVLRSYDWTACIPDFILAKNVLEENYSKAFDTMEKIGVSGNIINQESYLNWPLFKAFRETEGFAEKYELIYGEKYRSEEDDEISGKHMAEAFKKIMTPLIRELKIEVEKQEEE